MLFLQSATNEAFMLSVVMLSVVMLSAVAPVEGPCPQQSIFFVTYWPISLRVYPGLAFLLSVLKHSSLLGPFVNCEENELL